MTRAGVPRDTQARDAKTREFPLNRRSFLTALIGGIVAAGLAKTTGAQAAAPSSENLPAEIAHGLDGVDAEFSQNRRKRRQRERPPGSVDRRHWKHHHTRRRHNNFDRGRI
ncbi:hypothetical protein [Bosea sp. (in: a-proteobacteria)]|uniref:hypothetical protein n=1 Tax=Bosea sp. (in: a-proteobacteria) TaxID=1871050 RepID=UPI0026217B02|nr:hypothetical protein [Bosea sp. (in: a-proteobacteria)]MCO5091635.1 hypothetical protein [Bosea sp. (in: a-proteobacteria)]